jgi:integrase
MCLDWLRRDLRKLGLRPQTRDEYDRLLHTYALSYFEAHTRLAEIDTRAIQGFVDWLCRQPARGRKKKGTLSDASVGNALGALRSVLADAAREGEIRHNPCAGVKLPKRTEWDEDEIGNGEARPFPGPNGDVMEIVVGLIPTAYRLIFELLAWTGMRRSEILGLKGKDLRLSGGEPYVSVRRRIRRVKGEGLQVGPPKTKTSRRDIPIPVPLADRLAALHTAPEAWVFTSNGHGTPVDPDNLHSRVLRPACEEADCSWAGFHTFRHTVASRLIAEGRNVVQVSRFLGHANAHTTLSIYGHLLDGNVGGPLVLSGVRTKSARGGRETATDGDAEARKPAS